MTFIPDSISTNALRRLQVDAEADYVPAEDNVDLDTYLESMLTLLQENYPGPVAFKTLALRILTHLGAWHDMMADKKFSEKDDACLLWAADEKLLHMAWSCLDRVDLGEDPCECSEV